MSTRYTVNASALNARKGPSTDYAKITIYYKGDIVNVEKIENGWAQIEDNLWVSAQYLTKNNSSAKPLAASYTPNKDLDNRPIYLMQTDSRWKSRMYSAINDASQTIGSGGCGPSSACMIVNEWTDPSYGPVEACNWAASAGYRTSNNGTYWSMMKAIAVKYGYKFSQTSNGDTAKKFMDENPGSLVVCIMGKGNWTSSGHFILMYKCDGTYAYINDPASTKSGRQKNTFALLKSQCRQYFCFGKPGVDAITWANKDKIEDIEQNCMVVAATNLNVRSEPTTSNGNNIIFQVHEGALVYATKKCGDWYWITGKNTKNGKLTSGWAAASYLNDANIDNVDSDVASNVKEAIDYLVKIGFMDSPKYWYDKIFDMDYLANLIINIATAIEVKKLKKASRKSTVYTDIDKAVDALVRVKVINSPDYWKKNYKTVKYVDSLILRAAQWLS